MYARGILKPKTGWRTNEDGPSSGDDITAFVIPLCCYGSNAQMPMSPKLTVGRPVDWIEPSNSILENSEADDSTQEQIQYPEAAEESKEEDDQNVEVVTSVTAADGDS